MQSLNDLLYNFAIFIKRYPVVYFSYCRPYPAFHADLFNKRPV